MKKIIFTIILAVIAGIGFWTHADVAIPSTNTFYYVFHLYYDTGKLVADRDFKFVYDIIPGDYMADALNTQFPYRGEVINMVGAVADNFTFDPKQGNPKFTVGKISVKAPYVADGQRVVFYDNQNQPVLTISVSDSSFCNDDGICNADRGEDSLSCPKDCKQSLPAPPTITPTASPASSSGLWAGILYTILGILLIGLVWWLFKRRRNQGTLPLLPPPLPTPPTSPTPNNPV